MVEQIGTRVRRSGGGLDRVAGADAVRASIELLMATEPGDLIFDPRRGIGMSDLLLMSTRVIEGVLTQRVKDQFALYLRRVQLISVRAVSTDGSVNVRVNYRDTQDNSTQTVSTTMTDT